MVLVVVLAAIAWVLVSCAGGVVLGRSLRCAERNSRLAPAAAELLPAEGPGYVQTTLFDTSDLGEAAHEPRSATAA